MKKRTRSSIISIIISFLLIAGCIWQFTMERIDNARYQAPGSIITTDAYEMHYYSKGDGEIAIVFIPGSGTPCAYTDFYDLQENLSSLGQTISFDHAGSGWSSSTDEARTVENLESELRKLIDNVAPEKKVVLVCHSLGSLEAIYYAQTNSEKVLGIVFLDSGDPEFYRADSELGAKVLNRGIALTRTIGINRLLCYLDHPLPFYGETYRIKNLPEDICKIDKAMYSKYSGTKETLKSISKMNENAQKVVDGPRLGDIPILVLSSGSSDEWGIVQNTLATWSENSKQVTIEDSDHYLHWSNPDEVKELIRSFIDDITK